MVRRRTVEMFLSRAEAEAARYGASPFIFVRELIQNARDSGATEVELQTGRCKDKEWLICRDNGEGMRFSEARRFLFTLYASDKVATGARPGHAGRFGVGFWSVLRFGPSSIVVRSRTVSGSGWQVRLDGSLQEIEQSSYEGPCGTEIVLERSPRPGSLGSSIEAAARADARFVTRRDDPMQVLKVLVNGRPINEPFELAAPSLCFRGQGTRGVVGLGSEPRVELLSHGLRVRSAAVLEELLSVDGEASRRQRGSVPARADGLMPQVLIDSDRLQVLLARGDAREDRALRRAVGVARRELARLLDHQLDVAAPWSLAQQVKRVLLSGLEAVGAGWASRLGPGGLVVSIVTGVALAGALIGLGAGLARWPEPIAQAGAPEAGAELDVSRTTPFRDPAATYAGPAVASLSRVPARVALAYSPPGPRLHLAVFRVFGIDGQGRPLMAELDTAGGARAPAPLVCGERCVEIRLEAVGDQQWLRLPVPTGYAVDPASLLVDEQPVRPVVTTAAEVMVKLRAETLHHVRYRVGPVEHGPVLPDRWPGLPARISSRLDRIAALPRSDRVGAAQALVASLVRYDTSEQTSQLLSRPAGLDPLSRAVEIGAGDCDVQNSLLAAVLNRVGIPAHLAVGYLGRRGAAARWLHAWVELEDEHGRWAVADASLLSAGFPLELQARAGDARQGSAQGAPPARSAGGVSSSPVSPAEPRVGQRPPAASSRVLTTALVVLLPVALGMLLLRRSRVLRSEQLRPETDLRGLLRGMLQRPDAFAGLPGLLQRPLVPALGSGGLSLHQCRRLSGRSSLYSGSASSRLAVRAASRGASVVDAGAGAGRLVSEALALPDLDSWQRWLEGAEPVSGLEPLEKLVRRHLGPLRLLGARGLSRSALVLELAGVGLAGESDRVLLIDLEAQLIASALSLLTVRPALAAVLVGDLIVEEMVQSGKITAGRGARLLEVLSLASLEEGAELTP